MRGYYLAAQADEVLLNPDGMVLIEGFGRYRTYYREGIDRLGITWNVFRVGEYKSAVEPYLRNDMSPEAKEADLEWLGDIWRAYLAGVATARKTTPEALTAYIEGMPELLKAAGGDTAKIALDAKLVDKLAARDEVRKRMIDLAGEDEKTKSFKQVSMADYLEALGDDRPGAKGKGDKVAVVVAKGEIVDGTAGPGRIGGDSTAALIRKARQDEKVKAIVLRVDSGGGSAFASEVIRRELQLAQEAKKPVVVSMGNVAASGGYWIATSSDEIWASPETITGSIGIFGMFPTIEKPLAKYLGMHVDGVGTTSWAGALRIDRELDPRVGESIQQMINHGYEEFLARVAQGPEDEPRRRRQDRPRPGLERRRREGARPRRQARRPSGRDRLGGGEGQARQDVPGDVRREGTVAQGEADGGPLGPRDAGRRGLRIHPRAGVGAGRGRGSRHPPGRRGRSRPPLRLERPPRDLRPLLLRGEVAPAS